MDARTSAYRGAALIRGLARVVTTSLEAGRDQLGHTLNDFSERASAIIDDLRDRGDDALVYLNPGPWLEDVYSFLGIASSSSVLELDERIDDVEVKVEEVARYRAREELMLLQQRIGELESLLVEVSQSQSGEARQAMGGLLERLSDLESRIDALPIRDFPRERFA